MSDAAIVFRQTDEIELVGTLVRETILKIYPRYYPAGAVQFFLDLHREEKIALASSADIIYLLTDCGTVVGTGSIRGSEICRLFVRPEYQGKGYGSRIMDQLEDIIYQTYSSVHADASFPAEAMYLKRGYRITGYQTLETENGDYLCYHTMEKRR